MEQQLTPTLDMHQQTTAQTVTRLLELPNEIKAAELALDGAKRVWQARLATLTLRALTEPTIDQPGTAPRLPKNEAERDAARDSLLAKDEIMLRLALDLSEADATCTALKREFEAHTLIIKLIISVNR